MGRVFIQAGNNGIVPKIGTYPTAPITWSESLFFLSNRFCSPHFITISIGINELLDPVSTKAFTSTPFMVTIRGIVSLGEFVDAISHGIFIASACELLGWGIRESST